jgi:hypothetical protein
VAEYKVEQILGNFLRMGNVGGIRVRVQLDSPILWIDMYIPSADAMSLAEARAMSLNSQDCGSREITPYI